MCIKEVLLKSKLVVKMYQKIRSFLFKKNATHILETFKKALEESGIVFWLDYGTLLGAIREKDFIKHDFDIDLGVEYSENIDNKVTDALTKYGIIKIREMKVNGKIAEQTFKYMGIRIDIFYYQQDDNEMCTYMFVDEKKEENIYTEDGIEYLNNVKVLKIFSKKRGVEQINFKGLEYNVPERTHEYLIENYGENYMVPIKDWDYSNSPTNIIEVNECKGIVAYY